MPGMRKLWRRPVTVALCTWGKALRALSVLFVTKNCDLYRVTRVSCLPTRYLTGHSGRARSLHVPRRPVGSQRGRLAWSVVATARAGRKRNSEHDIERFACDLTPV